LALAGAAGIAVIVLAALGNFRPLAWLIGIAALLGGIYIDEPGVPRRRALGFLGVAIGLFALVIASFYT
jgi:hypothetical protein